ncbi:hypothetical protein G9A89_004576 [Geosiphon pyriformis]|nr:hypothetical protein G9A89_004576 [Geosiphon pyriformis]
MKFDGQFSKRRKSKKNNNRSPKNQALTKICGGIILTTLNITSHASFPTVDGGYGVAFIVEKAGSSNKTTINPYTKGIARNVIISAYVTFLDPNATKFGQNFLIYTTSQPAAREGLRFCFPKVLGNGFECTVGDDRISFLRNGAVIDITHLETRDQINRPLPYGGILVDTHVTDLQNFSSALIYDDNGNPKQQWPFPVSKGYLYNFMYDILPNNTFWGAYKELHSNNITLYIQDVPKFFKDNGYNNPMIESTTPPRNSKVSLESKLISVKYIQPITTSIKNISIYQFKGADPILRQTFPSQSQYCSLSDDQKSINIKVLSSTFNQPNGSYFVIIDNNFVKTRLLDEPLFGIKKNDWIITRDEEENVFAGSFTGLVRLTPDGSKFFRGLSTNAAREFINQLKVELAQTIPVDISRISTSDQHQEDPSSPFSQTLLKFTILSTQDSSQPNSFKLSQDLKTLIENKGITQLSLNPQSSLLDSDFGFRSTPNIWENLKLKIIILGVFIIFLLIVYILARRRFPEGNNFALINQVLVLFDLAMDVTFILYNGKDVKSLFLPSIIILAVVVTFNSGLAVYILVNEIKRNKNCVDWFQEYTKPAAMITLTSAANIESLKLLSSRFAGLKIFSLPLSPTAIQLIFWGGFINLFLEDIPQLIIQILYYNWSISYDIIPFLSLVTAVLSVLCNIIGRIYYLIIELYVKPNTFSRKIANYNDTLTLEEEQRSPILLDPQYTEPMD